MRILLFEVNSVLKSLFSAFTHTQNALVSSFEEAIKQVLCRNNNHNIFLSIFGGIAVELEKIGPTL